MMTDEAREGLRKARKTIEDIDRRMKAFSQPLIDMNERFARINESLSGGIDQILSRPDFQMPEMEIYHPEEYIVMRRGRTCRRPSPKNTPTPCVRATSEAGRTASFSRGSRSSRRSGQVSKADSDLTRPG